MDAKAFCKYTLRAAGKHFIMLKTGQGGYGYV